MRVSKCLIFVLLAFVTGVHQADAQKRVRRGKAASAKKAAGGPRDYRSKNFLIHTDLPPKEAKDLQLRLEKMVRLISRYWRRRNPRVIECWVVKDLKKWPPAGLQRMDPGGLERIRAGTGVTRSNTVRLGVRFHTVAKVYAAAHQNIPMHEAVHAFCSHAFGNTGPVWYSEGMAEMGKYWRVKDPSVHCSKYVATYLRHSDPKQLTEIVDPDQKTGDSWQNYAWRWALCHLLANNSNYSTRFRPLGLAMLAKRRGATFERVYGPMAKEINFEYHFFLKHLEPGYRVDLCSWDWKSNYRRSLGGRVITSKINAARGWQASRLLVKKGADYEYSATGTWKITKKGKPLTADGDNKGNGRLVGILFNDYKLSKPFELGIHGKFTAPSDGQLLLRCQSSWIELADNQGKITVKWKRFGQGNPLPKPKVVNPPEPKKAGKKTKSK